MSAMRGPPKQKKEKRDLWTEITKDLVIKEAIEALGYDYEENPDFFYIMNFLKYVSWTPAKI